MKQETYCSALWYNIFYKEFPAITKKPCCVWRGPGVNSDVFNTDPFELLDHPDMKRYRQMSLNGEWPEHCKQCKDREEQGLTSYRYTENQKAGIDSIEQLINAVPEVRTMDYRPGNTCNLKCRMCSPAESHLLFKEMIDNREIQQYTSYPQISDKWVDVALDYKFTEPNEAILNDEFFSNLKELKIFGGEPSIDPKVHRVIEWAIDNNYSQNLILRYITNATNANSKWLGYHKHFKSCRINFSLDAALETYEYIRTPARWEYVKANVLEYKRLTNSTFDANICYSLWSCFTISEYYGELITLLQDNNIGYQIYSSFRDNQAVNLLPDYFKNKILEELDKLPDSKFKKDIIVLTNKPAPLDWKEQIIKFFELTNKYDTIRKTDIFKLSPLYRELYNYIKEN